MSKSYMLRTLQGTTNISPTTSGASHFPFQVVSGFLQMRYQCLLPAIYHFVYYLRFRPALGLGQSMRYVPGTHITVHAIVFSMDLHVNFSNCCRQGKR